MTTNQPPAGVSDAITDQFVAECGEEYFLVREMSWDHKSMRAAIEYALTSKAEDGMTDHEGKPLTFWGGKVPPAHVAGITPDQLASTLELQDHYNSIERAKSPWPIGADSPQDTPPPKVAGSGMGEETDGWKHWSILERMICTAVDSGIVRIEDGKLIAAQPAPESVIEYRAKLVSAMELADKDGRIFNAQGCQQAIDAIDFVLAAQAQPAPVAGGDDAMCEKLREVLDCDTDGESLYMLVSRAANAIYWRGREIEQLKAALSARPAVESESDRVRRMVGDPRRGVTVPTAPHAANTAPTPTVRMTAGPAAVEGAQGASGGEKLFLSVAAKIPHGTPAPSPRGLVGWMARK